MVVRVWSSQPRGFPTPQSNTRTSCARLLHSSHGVATRSERFDSERPASHVFQNTLLHRRQPTACSGASREASALSACGQRAFSPRARQGSLFSLSHHHHHRIFDIKITASIKSASHHHSNIMDVDASGSAVHQASKSSGTDTGELSFHSHAERRPA